MYIKPNRNKLSSGMCNNGDANSLQYIFERQPMERTKKSYPAVGLSGLYIGPVEDMNRFIFFNDFQAPVDHIMNSTEEGGSGSLVETMQ